MAEHGNHGTDNTPESTRKISDHVQQPEATPSYGRRPGARAPFLWGAVSAVAVMIVAPLLRPAARSVVKAAIKAGRQAQQMGSALKEELEDITAEARAEMEDELTAKPKDNPEKA